MSLSVYCNTLGWKMEDVALILSGSADDEMAARALTTLIPSDGGKEVFCISA